ncbi:carbon starvation CstA family protein [Phocaeicola oris]|uniref:carbon starvation CstA family protein n=1 Tax=Phocaeicola oris TaxID=2896850 RepID=UPI00234F3DC4|nr:carbon starvation CstA family protein [Phocaeicola oris]MCE2616170.1 carbon starvation protein A [Phocaeicola oris]
MISFILALIALILGYILYGKFVEHVFKPDDRITPAVAKADGVDYIVLPNWKIFMIQFLNIAGTGPIFGAIMGAWYGPYAYLWIVLGCVFAGSVHDYFIGMLSVRHNGAGLPELVGDYLGGTTKKVMLVFSVLLLMMVGVVFVYSPAIILKDFGGTEMLWIILIFIYYIIATTLPIDKIIGKIYPLFAFALLFMAMALMIGLFIKWPTIPELWQSPATMNLNNPADMLGEGTFKHVNPVFPCMFITIACGAISGFHATQSPLMARCLKNERYGRHIFYGAMIAEGIVALIWASVSMYFFYYGGWREVVDAQSVQAFINQLDAENPKTLIQSFSAPAVVKLVCENWLGIIGGILAVLGVVAAPITSGDTAFRSARLIVAEFLHLEQRSIPKRLYICIPMFLGAIALLAWQMSNPNGFNVIWQYFGWANQTLAVFALWAVTVYLTRQKKTFIITLIPALFMTTVCTTFIFVSNQAMGLGTIGYALGAVCLVIAGVWFFRWYRKEVKMDGVR